MFVNASSKVLLTTALLFGLSSTVAAAEPKYIGVSGGKFQDEILDDSDGGWKVYVGLRAENLGFEFGYVDLGKVESRSGGVWLSAEQSGLNAVFLGYLPLSKEAAFFGKAGFFAWNVYIDSNSSLVRSGSTYGTDITYGVGFQYNFSRRAGVRAEWEHFEEDIGDLASFGVTFSF